MYDKRNNKQINQIKLYHTMDQIDEEYLSWKIYRIYSFNYTNWRQLKLLYS